MCDFLKCFFLVLLTYSCNQESPFIDGEFELDGIDERNSEYFVINDEGQIVPIEASGTYLEFDNVLFQDYNFETLNFNVQKLMMLTNNSVKVTLQDPMQNNTDTVLTYLDFPNFNSFAIILSENPEISLHGKISDDQNSISFAYKSYTTSVKDGSIVDYKPIVIEHLSTFDDTDSSLAEIVNDCLLVPNDTIAFNISNVVMRRN